MTVSSVIPDGHPARLRGNFAIHPPSESYTKSKSLQILSFSSFISTCLFLSLDPGSNKGGLNERTVIVVPASSGEWLARPGLTPLLQCLNPCLSGIAVVDIAEGFGAG
ncbi:hypothetical protein BMS3Bbin06_00488 [bacterium BMS3Bbin06]|nr:hypothetical protein BMS3Abin08_02120 [bacterium BMS3Abin08]GBE33972.1 hypothetical protein BMS3Bbin06_00488 [bacterium BMS3Bbin06]